MRQSPDDEELISPTSRSHAPTLCTIFPGDDDRVSIACSETLCTICPGDDDGISGMCSETECTIFPGDDDGEVDSDVVTAGGVGDGGVFTTFA